MTENNSILALLIAALRGSSGGGGGGGEGPEPYDSNPAMNGAANAGSSSNYARGDHVHPSDTSKADKVTEESYAGTEIESALVAGKIYHFFGNQSTGVLSSLTITGLTAPASGQLAHYHFDFDSGSTAPTLTLPNTVTMPSGFTVEANKHYEIDILNNYGAVMSW